MMRYLAQKVCRSQDSLDQEERRFRSQYRDVRDGPYGWVVVAASFLNQALSVGLAFSVGVFFSEWLQAFGRPRGQTAWIGGLNTGLLFGAGPIAALLANRFGHRTIVLLGAVMATLGMLLSAFATDIFYLYITYGVLAGLGFCFVYIPSVVVVALHFEARRNLAMGLAVAGCGAGSLVCAPLLRHLVEGQGWRGALLLTAGLCAHCLPAGALLRPLPLPGQAQTQRDFGLAELCHLTLLRDVKFIVFLLNNVLWNVGSLILLVTMATHAEGVGVPKSRSALLVSLVGLFSTVGRVLVGVTAAHRRCSRFAVFIASTAVTGVLIALCPAGRGFGALAVLAAGYGLFFGLQLGVLAVVTTELFGVHRLTSAYGYLMFGNGAGALLGPPVAGWLYDVTGSYDWSFYTGGAVTLFSAAMLLAIPLLQRQERHRTQKVVLTAWAQQTTCSIPPEKVALQENGHSKLCIDECESSI